MKLSVKTLGRGVVCGGGAGGRGRGVEKLSVKTLGGVVKSLVIQMKMYPTPRPSTASVPTCNK